MEAKEVIRRFLSEGIQVEPSALEMLITDSTLVDLAIKKAKQESKILVDKEFIESLKPRIKLKIIFFKAKPRKKSLSECSKTLVEKFDTISEFFENSNMISINKVSKDLRDFMVIGMVKEIRNDSLTIEDKTGELNIFPYPLVTHLMKDIVLDDVLLFRCIQTKGKVWFKEIFWPDIPLEREIRTSKNPLKIAFLSDFHLEKANKNLKDVFEWMKDKDYIFFLGDFSSKQEDWEKYKNEFPKNTLFLKGEIDKIQAIEGPCMVGVNGIKILIDHGNRYDPNPYASPSSLIKNLLRRRDISFSCLEPMVLKEVPDIFVLAHFHQPFHFNYKGTTLISLGSFLTQPVYYSIDLSTREVKEKIFN